MNGKQCKLFRRHHRALNPTQSLRNWKSIKRFFKSLNHVQKGELTARMKKDL